MENAAVYFLGTVGMDKSVMRLGATGKLRPGRAGQDRAARARASAGKFSSEGDGDNFTPSPHPPSSSDTDTIIIHTDSRPTDILTLDTRDTQ